jgi:hypothetical protein
VRGVLSKLNSRKAGRVVCFIMHGDTGSAGPGECACLTGPGNAWKAQQIWGSTAADWLRVSGGEDTLQMSLDGFAPALRLSRLGELSSGCKVTCRGFYGVIPPCNCQSKPICSPPPSLKNTFVDLRLAERLSGVMPVQRQLFIMFATMCSSPLPSFEISLTNALRPTY